MNKRLTTILLATTLILTGWSALAVDDVEQYRAEYQNEVRQLQEAHDMAARKLRRPDGTVDKASPEYQKIQQHYNTQKAALRNRFLANHPASKAWESLQQIPEGGKLSNTGSDPSSAPSDMDLSAADPATAKAAVKHLEGQGHKVTYDPELGMYLDHTTDTKIWEPGTPAQQKARASNPEGYTRSGSLEHEGISSPDAQYDPEGYVEDLNKKYEAAKKAGDTRTMNKVARKMQEATGKPLDPVTKKMGVDADPYESGETNFGESDAVKKAKAAERAEALDKGVQEARAKAKAQSESNSRMRNDLANKETDLGNKKSAQEYTDANKKIKNTEPKSGSKPAEPGKTSGGTDTAGGGKGKGVGEAPGAGKSGGTGGAVDTAGGGTGKGVGETTGAGKSGGTGGATETAGGGTGKGVGETTGAGKSGGTGGAVDAAGGGTGKGVGETTGAGKSGGTGGAVDAAGGGTGKGVGETTGAGKSGGTGGAVDAVGGGTGKGVGETTSAGKSGGTGGATETAGGGTGKGVGETTGAGKSGGTGGAVDTAGGGKGGGAVGEGPVTGDGLGTGEPRVTETSGPKAGETGGPKSGETGGPRVTEPGGPKIGETGGPKVTETGPSVTETGGGLKTGEPGGPKVTEPGAPKVGEPGLGSTELKLPKSVGKAVDAAGTAVETAIVINQAGKVYGGLKNGDAGEAVSGIVGEDAAKTAQVQGGKDYSDAMGQLLDAKTAEAQAAAEGKLKRMGATPEELKTYSDNYNKDPATARAVVQAVKDRGGVDSKPQQGLEGAGPEESSWNVKDQLVDGAKQAHGYADAATMGGLSHTENAVSDVFDITKNADALDDSTKAEQLSKMYTDLRIRGATPDEANNALKDYYKNPGDFHDLVKDLRERDPTKFDGAIGQHGKNLGGRGSIDIVGDDTVGDRVAAVGQELKSGLVDAPAKVVGEILGDITGDNQKTQAILDGAAARNKDGAAIRDQIYQDLIANGAKEGEARAAVNDLARGDRDTLRGLVSDLRTKADAAGKPTAGASGSKGGFGPKDPVTSDSSAFEGAEADADTEAVTDTGEPVDWGARNDAGEVVDAGAYENGDKIINKDGVEFVNQNGQWVETGENYGAYDAGADKGGTEAVSTPSIPDTGLDADGNVIADAGESQPADPGEAVAPDNDGEGETDETVESDEGQDPDDTADTADTSAESDTSDDSDVADTSAESDTSDDSDVAENPNGDDSESEDGEIDEDSDDEPSDDLADSEADMPDMEEGDDSGDEDDSGVLDGYADDREEDVTDRGQDGLDTMDNVLQVAKASNAGNQQVADANRVISNAGDDYNTSRGQSSSDTAAGDRENSWGTKMGDSIQEGLEQGLSQAATAVGAAAADQVTGQIFDGGRDDEPAGGGSGEDGGEGESGESSSGAAVSGGGGSGGGAPPPPPPPPGGGGGGAPPPPPSPPPPPPGGGGGAGALDCIKCYQCGAVFPKANNPGFCPSCGFGKNRQSDLTFSGWSTPCACATPPPPPAGGTISTPATAPAAPTTPAPPAPPPAPKGWKCPVCGSYDTKFSNSHPLYGDVYHCNGCGRTVHNVY